MPAFETMDRHDKAVYWAVLRNDRTGRPVLAAPIDLGVRWVEDTNEVRMSDGSTVSTSASVTLDRAIPIGGIMWKGEIADLPGTGMVPESDVMQVVMSSNVPDIKGRNRAYRVMLSKYSNKLPNRVS